MVLCGFYLFSFRFLRPLSFKVWLSLIGCYLVLSLLLWSLPLISEKIKGDGAKIKEKSEIIKGESDAATVWSLGESLFYTFASIFAQGNKASNKQTVESRIL